MLWVFGEGVFCFCFVILEMFVSWHVLSDFVRLDFLSVCAFIYSFIYLFVCLFVVSFLD